MSNRDEAIEFSDSRLCESNRRMFDGAGAKRWVSPATKDPLRCAGYSPLNPLWKSTPPVTVEGWASGAVLEEGAGVEDAGTTGAELLPSTPRTACGPCLGCGGGLRIIFGGGFSKVRIWCESEDTAKDGDTRSKQKLTSSHQH